MRLHPEPKHSGGKRRAQAPTLLRSALRNTGRFLPPDTELEKKARWDVILESCSTSVGLRGKIWIQVCSKLKPADKDEFRPPGSKATELGGVSLLTCRETSSGARDQGDSLASSVLATSGLGPQTAHSSQVAAPSQEPGERSPAAHILQKLAMSQALIRCQENNFPGHSFNKTMLPNY